MHAVGPAIHACNAVVELALPLPAASELQPAGADDSQAALPRACSATLVARTAAAVAPALRDHAAFKAALRTPSRKAEADTRAQHVAVDAGALRRVQARGGGVAARAGRARCIRPVLGKGKGAARGQTMPRWRPPLRPSWRGLPRVMLVLDAATGKDVAPTIGGSGVRAGLTACRLSRIGPYILVLKYNKLGVWTIHAHRPPFVARALHHPQTAPFHAGCTSANSAGAGLPAAATAQA